VRKRDGNGQSTIRDAEADYGATTKGRSPATVHRNETAKTICVDDRKEAIEMDADRSFGRHAGVKD